ncbi:MAG: translesion DNA synthesis-associated protein ImuA [Chromatiales bacterium]|nr:translesion DNA synthesis-associated protein ImuA [Chromatiales bacterium]
MPDLAVLASPIFPRIPTGFPSLDALLGGGWPTGMLTEVLVSGPGSGELGLLSPALARLTTGGTAGADDASDAGPRWVILIAPPWIPYAPGLSWQGLDLERVLVVRVRQSPEILWAMDETLRSGTCAAVIAWTGATGPQRAEHSLLRRLHLLAGKQQAWAVLVRAARLRRQRSPARLRLELLSPAPDTLQIEIFRNGWRGTGAVTVERRF